MEPRDQGFRFGGHGGSDQMGGTYRADRDGRLEILALVSNEKACLPERIMEVESRRIGGGFCLTGSLP